MKAPRRHIQALIASDWGPPAGGIPICKWYTPPPIGGQNQSVALFFLPSQPFATRKYYWTHKQTVSHSNKQPASVLTLHQPSLAKLVGRTFFFISYLIFCFWWRYVFAVEVKPWVLKERQRKRKQTDERWAGESILLRSPLMQLRARF